MSHVFQVGAGSGGMVVLDLLASEQRVTRVTLVEPDVYAAHNVHRHLFPPSSVGRPKAELAADWIRERRPDLIFETIVADLTDPSRRAEFERRVAECDLGVCAVDNEPAKFAFDGLMRAAEKPWTLGEVLSGGIGGWIHRFIPDGPCYGCVSSHLQRTVKDSPPGPPPDYANPAGAVADTSLPASKASIEAIASIHAVATLGLLYKNEEDFTSLLFTLERVPGVFEKAFQSFRFPIPRASNCLVCTALPPEGVNGDLDVAVDQALDRLAPQ